MSYQEIQTQDLFDLNYVLSNSNLNSKLIIAHFNIRGLNANFERLESFLASLKHKPQIIICTETRILECANFFNLDGYTAYYNESEIIISDGVVVVVRIWLKWPYLCDKYNWSNRYKQSFHHWWL